MREYSFWATDNFGRLTLLAVLLALGLSTASDLDPVAAAELPKNPEKLTPAEAVDAYLAVLMDEQQTNIKRNYAGARIVEMGKTALPVVVERYGSAGLEQRGYLASVLGAMTGSHEAQSVLLADLRENRLNVHPNVIRALGQIGAADARPLLVELLPRADQALRLTVIQALADLADDSTAADSTADVLLKALDDKDRLVRSAAANGLVGLLIHQKEKIESASGPEAKPVSTTQHDADVKEYERVRTAVLDYCTEGKSEDARSILVGGLGQLGDPKTVDTLLTVFKRGTPALVAGAADALGRLKAESAVNDLSDALESENEVVSHAAIHALVTIGDQRCVPALIRQLDNGPITQRRDIVRGLQTLTQQSFGEAPEAWRQWWVSQRH